MSNVQNNNNNVTKIDPANRIKFCEDIIKERERSISEFNILNYL